MDVRDLTRPDPGGAPALGKSRSSVLATLRGAGVPLTVEDVAERVGLHRNTTRFHLDGLVEAELADRQVEEREQPGRPRVLYAARSDGGRAGRRSYRLLAEILTGYMAGETPEPAEAALRAGRAWGRYLAERPPPFRPVDGPAAIRQLVRMLDDIGFAPEAVVAGRERQVLLRHCPFREVAMGNREVICSLHLGLMQGLLAEIDAPLDAEALDPFVEPSLCVTHLASRERAESAAST
ncbi:helix-turn-helix domain-containing protein [Nonomuraea sp. NPDC048916]|uniref:helix-turn-helix transcriptional regulator n=1 Tax=Nonomuraea sp. NPDC048916 TaxID=3154232 RepID=UPI0033C8D78F